MSGITDLMLALLSLDGAVRGEATQQVNDAKENDFSTFITLLITELRDDNAPPESRQMAGSLLKNNIALNLRDHAAKEELEQRWRSLNDEVRGNVKGQVLSTLGCDNREVRATAANIIGNLARIELPENMWPDLLETLVGAANGGETQFQEAALTALGYICEESNNCEELEDVLAQCSTEILSAVISGMTSQDAFVRYYATNALNNSMEFCEENMKNDEQRNFLVSTVCDSVQEGEERTRKLAMQALVKVADLYYDCLPEFIDKLFELTKNLITAGDSEDVALQGFLFWISVCDTEREMLENNNRDCHNYAAMGNEQLTDIIKWALVQQDDFQTEDDWNVSIAAGKLLQSLAETVRDGILGTMMDWIYANINSQDWHQREAAVMAFGCVMGGPDPKEFIGTVADAVPTGLLDYLRDENPLVQDTAAWVMCVVAELFPDVLLDGNNNAQQNLRQLFNIIGPMLTGDSVPMAIRAADIISNLSLYYEDDNDMETNALSPFFGDICHGLVGAMDREDGADKLRQQAQEALNTTVDAAAFDSYDHLFKLVPEILNRLRSTFGMLNDGASETDVFLVQGLFCGTLNGVARKLGNQMAPIADEVIELLCQIFQQNDATVQDEALLCVGAMAHSLNQDFMNYIGRVGSFIQVGLSNTDEFDLCNVAVGVVGDVASSCGPALIDNGADELMQPILEGLKNDEVNRDLKCSFLSCLGDFALNIGPDFSRYVDTFMEVVGEMDMASRGLVDSIKDDWELEDYAMNLWEAICSFYTGVTQCFKDNIDPIMGYMQSMMEFCLFIAPAVAKCEDVFSAALGVMGDIANVISEQNPETVREAKSFMLQDSVYNTIKEALTNGDNDTKKQAKWAKKQIEAIESVQ